MPDVEKQTRIQLHCIECGRVRKFRGADIPSALTAIGTAGWHSLAVVEGDALTRGLHPGICASCNYRMDAED